MRNNRGQMLLLTGITMIIIFISASFISTQVANISVESALEKSHPLSHEFTIVQEKFEYAVKLRFTDFDKIAERFKDIEAQQNIIFDAILIDDAGTYYIEISLQDDTTLIKEKFVYGS